MCKNVTAAVFMPSGPGTACAMLPMPHLCTAEAVAALGRQVSDYSGDKPQPHHKSSVGQVDRRQRLMPARREQEERQAKEPYLIGLCKA